jgi:small GTP-binding protein
MSEPPIESKVIFIGNATVGKTCIVNCVLTGGFSLTTVPTVGAGFSLKAYVRDSRRYVFQVWDTAGHERFRSMTPLYYRGAAFAVIVFAVDDRDSFDRAEWWRATLADAVGAPVSVFLVGNKVDVDARAVPEAEARQKAAALQAQYFEVSAKTGAGVDALFGAMVDDLRQHEFRSTRVRPSALADAAPARECC